MDEPDSNPSCVPLYFLAKLASKDLRVVLSGEKGNRHTFAAIDKAVRDAGCDCAILGCTELSVYREYHGLPSFYIDAMEVLAEECIRFFDREPLHV